MEELWLTVGEVSRRTGLSVRTLHHWDQRGLLVPDGRSAGGYRLYSPENFRRLLHIQHLKALGLGLDEVSAALDAEDFDARDALEEHIATVEQRLEYERNLLLTLRALRQPASTGWQEVLSAVAQMQRLRHPEAHVRFRAALDATSALPLEALLSRLVTDPEAGVREGLTWAIARHGTAAVHGLLPLLEHPDAVVRHQALHTLSKVGDASAVPRVAELLHDPDEEVACKAAQVLGRLAGRVAADRLVEALDTDRRDVADAVVAALGHTGEVAVPPLTAHLRDGEPRVRARTAEALGLVGAATAAAALSELVTDPDEAVRFEAVVALGHLPGEVADEAIRDAVDSPDGHLRRVADRLLQDRGVTRGR